MAKCRTCGKKTPKNENKRSSKYYCNSKCHILNSVEIKKNGCWNAIKGKRTDGYHNIGINGKHHLQHRASWKSFIGEIPDDKIVCHKCDNRSCCNPEHLYLGTHSTNAIDRQKRNPSTNQTGSKNHRAFLCEDKVKYIRSIVKVGFSKKEIANYFGISRGYLNQIISRKRWAHV